MLLFKPTKIKWIHVFNKHVFIYNLNKFTYLTSNGMTMDTFDYEQFVDKWDLWAYWSALGCFLLAALAIVGYFIVYLSKGELKKKYDFAATKEIRTLNLAFIVIGIGSFAMANAAYTETVKLDYAWLIIRFFIAGSIATLIIYISILIFKYSYPAYLDKKLRRLRYKPRFSPAGNEMKLLSEDEEDIHLDEGMQAEENLFSVDYDVWVDEDTDYIKIEKYPGYFTILDCRNCGFHTLKLVKEELVKEPTAADDGLIKKFYNCGYCGRKEERLKNIANLDKYKDGISTKSIPAYALKKGDELIKRSRIDHVRITIVDFAYGKDYFEFQSLEEARKFLNEYKEK